MSAHTTFHIGGPASAFIEINEEQQLADLVVYLKKVGIPFFVLGNGSNLLVSDEGYDGVILRIGPGMQQVTVEGNRIVAQAGALMSQIAKHAYKNGLTGLEFASGIPGTIGGGVVMNAGAYDGELSQVVTLVKAVDYEGNLLELDNRAMEFGYRTSAIKNHPYIVTEVTMELTAGEPQEIMAVMQDLAARRRDKQPLEFPSAGSTFKRPEGNFAGKLIMDAGLRGYQIGGARVSDKHCGFVINAGEATCEDVRRLMAYVQEKVYEAFGVDLEPEVIYLGSGSDRADM